MNELDRELEGLMNDQLDGVATSQDSERLRLALEAREELRMQYQRLGAVFAALDRLGTEEPPASLKQDVLRSIRLSESPAPARASWLGYVLNVIRGGTGLRQAYAFAAGAALGVLGFAILTGNLMTRPGTDTRPYTGMMAPLETLYRSISSRDFKLGGDGRVLAEALSGKDGLLVRLTADAPVGSDVALSFEPGDWTALSVRQEPAGNEVMLGMGRLSIRMQQSGQSQYLLYLARRGPAGSPLRIAIHYPDGFVQGELETRALRSGS